MAGLLDGIRKAFEGVLSDDVMLERVASYLEREVRKGRPTSEILNDPYIKNRLDGRAAAALSSPRVIDAVSASVAAALRAAGNEIG